MAVDKMELGMLGLQGLTGLMGGIAQGNQREQSAESQALQLRLNALMNNLNLEQGLQNQRTSNAAAYADRSPLGGEQDYARQQAAMAAIIPMLQRGNQGARPTDPGVAGAYQRAGNPFEGIDFSRLSQTLSPNATARAITDRRTALAGIDPTATQHLRPLSDYGLDQEGVFNSETENRTNQRLGENQQSEAAMRAAAMQMYNLSEQQAQQLESQGGGGGFWKKLLGPIAGIASSFIPGVGPLISGMIGAGVGGATGGVGGAIGGGLAGGFADQITGGIRQLLNGGNASGGYQLNNQLGQVAPTYPGLGLDQAGGNQLNLPSRPTSGISDLILGNIPQNPAGVPGSSGSSGSNNRPPQIPAFLDNLMRQRSNSGQQVASPASGGLGSNIPPTGPGLESYMINRMQDYNQLYPVPFGGGMSSVARGAQAGQGAGRVLQGEIVEQGGNNVLAQLAQMLKQQVSGRGPQAQLSGQQGLPQGQAFRNNLLPGPRGQAVNSQPSGPFSMGGGNSPGDTITKILATLPDGPQKMAMMRKIILGQ